jgi:hypothetical protein
MAPPARKPRKENFVASMCDEAEKSLPDKYKPYMRNLKPAIVGTANFFDAAYPYLVQAYQFLLVFWARIEPYNPQQFLPVIAGLMMCFFGGSYLVLIAAAEAIRLSVWERLSTAVRVLYKNYCIAWEANKKDNDRDDDNDGVADVDQISSQQLFTRKMYLVAKSVDPEQTTEAVGALWAGFLSVLATIRIKFAQYITLGCAMGDMARDSFGPKLQPLVYEALPPELKKWAPSIVRQVFATLGVIIAFFLQQVVGGFHSAVRGSQLATQNAIILAKKYGFLADDFDEKSQKASAAAMVLAFVGFFWQLRSGFAVPFPLNIIFFPATLLEWFLSISLTIGL